jgi:hypothetical protein
VSHSALRSTLIVSLLVALLAFAAGRTTAGDVPLSKRDAERFQQKVLLINKYALTGTGPARTAVTESEVNSYLAFVARDQMPDGVVDPYVSILGTGRLSARAVVDLDGVRRQHAPGGWLDPMSYLTGRLPVSATGVLSTNNGVARFQLESAQVSGIPIPKTVLQQVLSYYSRTASNPQGLNLDDPFPLPARIREIQVVRPGEAIVVQ